MQCDTLRRLASDRTFPDYAHVQKLLDRVDNGEESAKGEVAELRRLMVSEVPENKDDLSVWTDVMGAIDVATCKAFESHKESIGVMTADYITPLSSYRQNVILTLRRAWFKRASKAKDDHSAAHLDRIIARVAIHLTPEQASRHPPEPLLCGFMLSYAWAYLKSVEEGIAEVRCKVPV
jgi:hypothetical protein